jgi:hypothetical protein
VIFIDPWRPLKDLKKEDKRKNGWGSDIFPDFMQRTLLLPVSEYNVYLEAKGSGFVYIKEGL